MPNLPFTPKVDIPDNMFNTWTLDAVCKTDNGTLSIPQLKDKVQACKQLSNKYHKMERHAFTVGGCSLGFLLLLGLIIWGASQ